MVILINFRLSLAFIFLYVQMFRLCLTHNLLIASSSTSLASWPDRFLFFLRFIKQFGRTGPHSVPLLCLVCFLCSSTEWPVGVSVSPSVYPALPLRADSRGRRGWAAQAALWMDESLSECGGSGRLSGYRNSTYCTDVCDWKHSVHTWSEQVSEPEPRKGEQSEKQFDVCKQIFTDTVKDIDTAM